MKKVVNTIGLIVSMLLVNSMAYGTAKTATLIIQVDKPGAKISPTMWGTFFEDINFAADGGLYAELVKNRSFEFPKPMMGWNEISPNNKAGSIKIQVQDPFNEANPHYLRIIMAGADKNFGVYNEGFRGMGIRGGEEYLFSAQVRAVKGKPALSIELVTNDGRKLAGARLDGFTKQWEKHSATLRAAVTELKSRLNIYVEGQGVVDIDMVSLFPKETWKNRPNGLRIDLVQMIADLKPSFIKFPGGFLTEGRSLETRYQWKLTIDDLAERKLMINTFNRFPGRSAPDYFQSYGLGFFEFFQLCEDLGAEPQPVLSCGMAAQFTSQMAPPNQLEPYIQEVLDLIEFANGPVTSEWGKKRAEMGHPKPFNLKMIRLGNEQQGQPYIERYEKFAGVIKTEYPEIKLIAGTGPDPDDDNFKYMWSKLRELKADIVDEHAHKQPDWFFSNSARYDSYDRNGPKVTPGEWAAHSEPGLINQNNRSNLECALSEAAFMTGLERNADVAVMSCYAPLFGHVDAWQWVPNLIWFDNLNVYGTPSYYVQKMFSCNRGDIVLPINVQTTQKLYASAVRDEETGEIILKIVNPLKGHIETQIDLSGAEVTSPAKAIILTSPNLTDENSFEAPKKIFPVEETVQNVGSSFSYSFRPYSLTILRLSTESK
jgi:alpha-N-arabinofuranosidase